MNARAAPIYRRMRRDELPLALDWAAAEGWNPGLDDAGPFLAADPQGFFAADVAGQMVAAISVVNHSATNAFLGLYICRPDWRGRGVGLGLWSCALEHAGGRVVGLDGVAAQQANYERSGFVASGATTRMEGRLEGALDPAIRSVQHDDLPPLIALDAAAGGYPRDAFLTAWLAPTPERASVTLTDTSGFATIRRCREGAKIGPVIAPDADTALRLIRVALAIMPANPVLIDLPASSSALADYLTGAGFRPAFRTTRMYRGTPAAATGAVQAIATMELG